MSGLLQELKRRNVFRVAIAYVMLAWIIAQVAELALDSFGAPAWVMKTLLLLLALGLLFAIFFSWAFELTPDGLKKEKDVDRSQSITPRTGRKLNTAIIGLLVIALAFVVMDNYVLDRSILDEGPVQTDTVSIAVLPFVNMSNDADQEYFSDGISEELLNLLAKIPKFQVAGRTSSFTFKGENQDLRDIGQKLGVDHILEGSVRKSADQVRITAQLIKASDGFHLWSETYDRKLDDIFAVQDDISGEVVKALKVKLLGGTESLPKAQTDSRDGASYDAYLKGLFYFNKSGDNNLRIAVGHMQEAVNLAPQSALAWAGLSRALTGYGGQGSSDPTDVLLRARAAAEKALALDTSQPDAHQAMADITFNVDWDWAAAEAQANRVLELRPGDLDAQMMLAQLHITFGRLEQAEQLVRLVLAHDPLNDRHPRALVSLLHYQHKNEEALELAESLLKRDPLAPFLRAWIVAILNTEGRTMEALRYAEGEPVQFARLLSLATVHHELGNSEEAVAAQQQLKETYGNLAAFQQAIVFAVWGDFETAIDWLEIAVNDRDPGTLDIKANAALSRLHGHPRYEALLRKMNLAD
jgi:TolB-like protein